MGTPYETDVVAWAHEQAELLRSSTRAWPFEQVLDNDFWPD
jgi:hypothetical protein